MDVAEILNSFAENGYARMGRVLSDEGISELRERAEDLMLGRVVYPGMFFQMDAETGNYRDAPLGQGWQGPSLAYRKLEKLEMDARFRSWINNPLFERIVWTKIAGEIAIYRAIVFNKGAPGGSDIPWHQDGGKLWGLSEEPELQIWTALDDAPTDGGCLEVIPGSHASGFVTALGGVIPSVHVQAAAAEQRAVPLPALAGECILVHNRLWHRSGRSRTGKRRMALSICYMSANVRCLRTKRAPRQFFRAFQTF